MANFVQRLRLGEVGKFEKLMLNVSTSAPILPNRCYVVVFFLYFLCGGRIFLD